MPCVILIVIDGYKAGWGPNQVGNCRGCSALHSRRWLPYRLFTWDYQPSLLSTILTHIVTIIHNPPWAISAAYSTNQLKPVSRKWAALSNCCVWSIITFYELCAIVKVNLLISKLSWMSHRSTTFSLTCMGTVCLIAKMSVSRYEKKIHMENIQIWYRIRTKSPSQFQAHLFLYYYLYLH